MAKNFKKQLTERRTTTPRVAIPQVDPEAPKPTPAVPVVPARPTTPAPTAEPARPTERPAAEEAPDQPDAGERPLNLTIVDGDEAPQARGTQMRPSRHEQLRDLAYIEKRKFWVILDDALEMYVTKTYGRQYKKK